jgi:hypothetical protein
MSIGPYGDGSFGTGEFSSSPFYSTAGLIDAILRASGHSTPATQTAKRAFCLDALNNRYSVVTTSQHWDWLYQEVDTLFKEPEETGTVNMTNRSQSVVGVSTVFSANVVPNNVLSIPTRNETYLISTVESNTALTLEGQFAGETEEDLAYKIIKPIYTMPSDLETIQSIQLDGVSWEMVPVGRQEFTRIKQHNPGQVGPPRWYTEIARRTDGVRLIEIYPAPDKDYSARLHYGVNISKLSDSADDYPLLPDRHRAILYYGGLADMFGYLRDATMMAANEDRFQLALANMRNDTKITDSRIQFQPKRNYRNRTGRRNRRRRSYSASDLAQED